MASVLHSCLAEEIEMESKVCIDADDVPRHDRNWSILFLGFRYTKFNLQ
jgi:hypothetical protein